jgi:iron complex transport system ATP-binding protein
MSEPLVEARRVTYRVGKATLVEEVDFVARPGEVVGILGPNGAGKTTLLGLLAGDLLPSAGEVFIGGTSTRDTTPRELSLLRAVHGDPVHTDIPFTARAVVTMGRHPYRGIPDNTAEQDDAAVDAAMERTSTVALAGRTVATLSSGERARVLLARALAQETPLLLLDEPTASLDVGHGEHILTEGSRMAAEGRSVVAVFHDLNEAARHAHRLTLMDRGRVVASGTPREVLRSDLLSEVYAQRLEVVDHPFLDCPLVLVAGG